VHHDGGVIELLLAAVKRRDRPAALRMAVCQGHDARIRHGRPYGELHVAPGADHAAAPDPSGRHVVP